ncbi:MAG: stage II sporulation protein P, partial [Oscillospiraceae bacterium]|nr:stage II sporulation protein P [Oscillospiraceae bacterium]
IYTKVSGEVERCNFGYFDDPNIVTLNSGAQLRNLTEEDNDDLLDISEELPWDELEIDPDEPLVLIYHTHTCESFMPFGYVYDEDYPVRSVDCSKNITAVGDAICEALSRRGISSVHDCTVNDDPMFTGAYYRSADSMLEILEEYPSIVIAIDIHRDGIINADGSITAPIADINGKTAAQFMIITGCDSDDTPLPDYRENLKLACLIQNAAEDAYPSLARPIMFDYRSYNQPLFEGNLLIEIGSQANTFEEAEYCGELLGNSIAKALFNI